MGSSPDSDSFTCPDHTKRYTNYSQFYLGTMMFLHVPKFTTFLAVVALSLASATSPEDSPAGENSLGLFSDQLADRLGRRLGSSDEHRIGYKSANKRTRTGYRKKSRRDRMESHSSSAKKQRERQKKGVFSRSHWTVDRTPKEVSIMEDLLRRINKARKEAQRKGDTAQLEALEDTLLEVVENMDSDDLMDNLLMAMMDKG